MKQLYPIVNNMENLFIVCHFVADVGIGGNLWNTFFERNLLELRFLGKNMVQSTKLKVPTAEGTWFPKVHH